MPSSTAGTGVFNEGYVPTVTINPASGVAHVSFPFSLPAAQGIAQPSLSLIYSSDAGTRTAGAGWGLDLPVIDADLYPTRRVASAIAGPVSGATISGVVRPTSLLPPSMQRQRPGRVFPAGPMKSRNYYRNQVEGNFARIFPLARRENLAC